MGLDGTLVNNPAVGVESNLLTARVSGLGFTGDGRIRWVLTIPCWRPSLFMFGVCCGLMRKMSDGRIELCPLLIKGREAWEASCIRMDQANEIDSSFR